jgi:hypothetical protein
MQIKTTMKYHFISPMMARIKKKSDNKYWQGCEETGTLYTAENVKWHSHFGKQFDDPSTS